MSERFSVIKKEVDFALARLLADRSPASLYEPMAYVLDAGGKRIRPALVMLCAEAAGGRADEVMSAALAVEILHTFTLVHDDIMDNDAMRRGLPTVHVKWDEATAILAGDGLVTLAYQQLLMSRHAALPEALRVFTDGLLLLCEGQAMDKDFETRDSVPLDEYLVMIQKKTAQLLEVACQVGAILGGGDVGVRGHLAAFARAWGEAFQIQDDWLDVFGDAEKLGKPSCSDISARKQTFLTLHFFEQAETENLEKMKQYWGRPGLSPDEIANVRELLKSAGSDLAAREAVAKRTGKARLHLEALDESQARHDLLSLVAALEGRQH